MDHTTYQSNVNGVQDALETLTGSRDTSAIDPNLVHSYLTQNWTSTELQNHLQNDAKVNEIAPWLKLGFTTAQSWKAHMNDASAIKQVEQRFGPGSASQD